MRTARVSPSLLFFIWSYTQDSGERRTRVLKKVSFTPLPYHNLSLSLSLQGEPGIFSLPIYEKPPNPDTDLLVIDALLDKLMRANPETRPKMFLPLSILLRPSLFSDGNAPIIDVCVTLDDVVFITRKAVESFKQQPPLLRIPQ